MTPIDAREVPAGQIIACEVCIVGGGAAALTVARELAGGDFWVCLLESGGTTEHEATKDLSSGAVIGNHSLNLQFGRWRQYGGAANRWLIELGNGELGVRYTPLDAIDFEQRDWLPYSGWPFRKPDLDPFYRRAQQICRIGPYSYEPEDWEDAQTPRLPFPSDQIVTKMFQFGRKTVFTRDIPHELGQAGNIAVYLYANVTEIETDETGKTATRVKVACLGDKQFYVAARHFVLATGGTENARILLLSDRVQPTGLGNRHDLVGRFFNVHPQFHHDRLTPVRRDLFSRARLYDLRSVNQVMVMGRLGLARAVMEKEQLRNLGVMLLPREEEYWSKEKEKANSKRTKPASKPSVLPAGLLRIARSRLQSLGRLVAYLPNVSKTRRRALPEAPLKLTLERGGWSNLPDVDKRYATFEMVSLVEQAPDPANRVMLGLERDPLGARRLELHWRWSESDHKQVLRSRSRIGHELARSGLGTFELVDAEPKHPDSSHHIGTTRMHHDPRFGVVDANCRVHGVANLFVAGSSVFPTGGFANPTLTIVALAARLAEHIKKVCLGFAQD